MEIRLIDMNSPEYGDMRQLRLDVLLNPIGVSPSYINPEKEKNDLLIGAFEGDRIIGCCVLTPLNKDLIQLRQMAVRPDVQGRGIGAAIVTFAEQTAKEKDFKRLMMHARDVVIPFYQKCGYSIAGEQFTEVGIDHHRMEKSLA
jgi:N-acetylglutamate synthase-like GNAT family acetyltransferase